jgi:hypothetical protein
MQHAQNNPKKLSDGPKTDQTGYAAETDNVCSVSDEQFPCMGKCCICRNIEVGSSYKKVCCYCSIWKSPPDSVSLEIATIVECERFGYGKRLKKI